MKKRISGTDESMVVHYLKRMEYSADDQVLWNALETHGLAPLQKRFLNIVHQSSLDEEVVLLNSQETSVLYTLVYKICQGSKASSPIHLYHKLQAHLIHFMKNSVAQLLHESIKKDTSLSSTSYHFFSQCFLSLTRWYPEYRKTIVSVFRYLDRNLQVLDKTQNIETLTVSVFRIHVVRPFRDQLLQCFLSGVNRFRSHKHASTENCAELLRLGQCIKGICDVDPNKFVYLEIENNLLSHSKEFYLSCCSDLAERTIAGFLQRSEALLIQEMQILSLLRLPQPSPQKFIKLFRQCTLESSLKSSLSDELLWIRFIGSSENFSYLKILFKLFHPSPESITSVGVLFHDCVVQRIAEQCIEPFAIEISKPKRYRKAIAELHCKLVLDIVDHCLFFEQTLISCFSEHLVFKSALSDALFTVLHKPVPGDLSFAEILARVFDFILRKKSKAFFEFNGNRLHDSVWTWLGMLVVSSPDHDLFSRLHHKYTANRLLNGQSASEELERSVLLKFKSQLGNQFIARKETIIGDISTSRRICAQFLSSRFQNGEDVLSAPPDLKSIKLSFPRIRSFPNFGILTSEHNKKADTSPIQSKIINCLDFKILTSGVWPEMPMVCFQPPKFVSEVSSEFQEYYKRLHPNRSIKWYFHIGSVVLSSNRGITLFVDTLQASLLLVLAKMQNQSATVVQLSDILELDSRTMMRVLASLSRKKFTVIKRIESKDGGPHVFMLNPDFMPKSVFIKIPPTDLSRRIERRNSIDSISIIKSFTVRLLKKERKVSESVLIASISVELCRFLPSNEEIRSAIESLVENDFIRESTDDSDEIIYEYLP